MTFEEYTEKLFALIKEKADVMDFQDLYYVTFEKMPSEDIVLNYKKTIGAEVEDDIEYESYSYSYEESYDEDDD